MYSVSEAYKERMMHHGIRRRLSGTIGSVPFTSDDVVRDSFSISGKAAESSDMKIGGVYIGELSMTLVPSFIYKIPKEEYSGKEVSVNIGLWIPDEEDEVNGGSWVDVPCGVFTLDEESPQLSKEGITVTGYDHMAKFDKRFNLDVTEATLYGYLNYICVQCGVELGMTEQEVQALPNGTDLLGLYTPNDIETCRDLIYWIAQTAVCFACCDRYGRLVLRKFGNPTDVTFDEDHRDDDVVFSGYTTKWTGISFVDIESQFTRYYGLEVDDGLTMNLGANPLLQIGSADAVERRRMNVLYGVAEIQYTPFYFNSARDPIFDLGDEINFTGGLSGTCTGCAMSVYYSMSNSSFDGYGDKPTLVNARSKTDKNISGLMQSTVENEVTYYNFANLEEIRIEPDEEVSIASFSFISAQKTTVKIMHEIKMSMDFPSSQSKNFNYELHYYLDGELLSYKPAESFDLKINMFDFQTITRDFFYVLKDIEPNVRHTWEVRIANNSTYTLLKIDADCVHITLEGQRMYSQEYWGGYIDISDIMSVIPLGNLSLKNITDTASVSVDEDEQEEIKPSDDIKLINIGHETIKNIIEGTGAEAPSITISRGFPWTSETGPFWATEDGSIWFTD